MIDSRKLVEMAAEAADDKKATSITLIEVEKVSSVTDYFLVCSGHTPIQVRAIADHLSETLEKAGIVPLHVEGQQTASWLLIDYGVLVVHVMLDREREFYHLERLWSHGRVEEWRSKAAS